MKKFTDEKLKELLNSGYSQADAAREFRVNESSITRRLKKLAMKEGWRPEGKMCPEGYKIKGESTLYDSEGNVKIKWVKTQTEKEDIKAFKEAFEEYASDLPKLPPVIKKNKESEKDLMVVYPLGDPHVGMLAWGEETDNENWDLEIAEATLCEVFERAVKSAPSCGLAVIINLGDFFHYDNMEGYTSRSKNILDIDGRYAKMVSVGMRIMRRMISEALLHHDKVRVRNEPGNHDETGALFLSIALSHIYENEPRVEIDTNPGLFHFIKFGKVLIGSHHGHGCKMDKLPGVMAARKHKEWGETEFRYWMTGHIHHDSKKEYPGCIVESFRTVAAPDAYAASGGYNSGRDTKAIVYHKDFGEIERHTINISRVRMKNND